MIDACLLLSQVFPVSRFLICCLNLFMDMYEGTSLWVKDIRLNLDLLFNGIAIFKSEDEKGIAQILIGVY